jgi:hypothetical protein
VFPPFYVCHLSWCLDSLYLTPIAGSHGHRHGYPCHRALNPPHANLHSSRWPAPAASSSSDGNDLLFDGGNLCAHLIAPEHVVEAQTHDTLDPDFCSSNQPPSRLDLLCLVQRLSSHSSSRHIVLAQGWRCEDANDEIVDGRADLLLLIVNEAAGSWSVMRSTC